VVIAIGLVAMPSPKRALAARARRRRVSLAVLWLLAGQPLPALGDYLRNAIDTISGYVEAMGFEKAESAGEWQLLVILGSRRRSPPSPGPRSPRSATAARRSCARRAGDPLLRPARGLPPPQRGAGGEPLGADRGRPGDPLAARRRALSLAIAAALAIALPRLGRELPQ